MTELKEQMIENYLKKYVESKGGMCLKFVPASMRGVPDRIILLPDGIIFFAELKAPCQKPRPEQIRVHELFQKLGAKVFVIDSKQKVQEIFNEIYSA